MVVAPAPTAVSSTVAARKAGTSAAVRLFRGIPRGPRSLHPLRYRSQKENTDEKTTQVQQQLLVGPIFDIVVPSAAMAPSCLCCGALLLSWEKLAVDGHRLPLGRGGFYACCEACDLKNQAVFTKEWKQTLET